MIVSLAAGSSPTASLNLTNSIQTMTGYIVEVATGDATFGSDMYYSIYAVGFTLFIFINNELNFLLDFETLQRGVLYDSYQT